jgi:hypothetical protein
MSLIRRREIDKAPLSFSLYIYVSTRNRQVYQERRLAVPFVLIGSTFSLFINASTKTHQDYQDCPHDLTGGPVWRGRTHPCSRFNRDPKDPG